MVRYFFIFALCVPLYVAAYTSPIVTPENQRAVLELGDPSRSHEYFGELSDFPHTFTFMVPAEGVHTVRVSVPDIPEQKTDISLILVKSEKRGVTEVARTEIKNTSWERVYSHLYAEYFREGGMLNVTLPPGQYILEVSAPNNDGKYRLSWGEESAGRGYIANVRSLFELKAFLSHSYFGALLSPLLYIPLLLILCTFGLFIYRRRRK